MKNVLLITRHAIPNYGSFLQTVASVQIFQEMGYDVKVLDYIPELEKPENLFIPMLNGSKFSSNPIKKLIYSIVRRPDFWKMGSKFREFQKKGLPLTKEYNDLSHPEKELLSYDLYVTGSDQVWGPIALSQYDENYFWKNFPTRGNYISFSSSFGKARFDGKTKKAYSEMLNKYRYMLVREDTAIGLLNEMHFDNCSQILDPTLIMPRELWKSYVEGETCNYKDYILVYQVHDNPNMDQYVRALQKKTGKQVIRLSNSFAHIIRIGKLVYLPSPKQFLSLIKNADYVVTNSFHATVFSLVFKKQFIIIDSGDTNTRISSLLRLVKQDNRQISHYKDFSQLDVEIDYDSVDCCLDTERKRSVQLLKTVLSELKDVNETTND